MESIIVLITRQGFPCLFQLATGLYCPGCGGTRAIRALMEGKLLLSFQYHPLILYSVIVAGAEAVSLLVARKQKNPRWYLGHEAAFVYAGIAITVINWIFKNYMLLCRGIDLLPDWPL